MNNDDQDKLGNSENTVERLREFERFCLWLCMPTMFKGKTANELQESFLIDDEEMQELCAIRTQTEFSEKYNVNKNTLTDWKLKAKKTDMFKFVQDWARRLQKNVVASTYRSAMQKDPKAHQDRKLMLQLGGWSEENVTNVKIEGLADIIKIEVAERKRLREEREKNEIK